MRESAGWLRVIHATSSNAAALERIVQAELGVASVLRIVGAPAGGDVLAFWRGVGAVLEPEPDFAARWSEVAFESEPTERLRPGEVAHPLHSDAVWEADASVVTLFYLERQSRSAGDTLFIDAGTVAACARRLAPDLHDRLFGIPVRFGRAADAARTTPILRREDDRLKIRWDYFRVTPGQGDAVDALRRDFRLFLDDLFLSGDVAAQRLETGDAVFVLTDEVLIGRAADGAKPSGDRILWKTRFRRAPREATGERGRTRAA